jgi:Chromo (CHRromatin Organisation MOdifier) domain
MLKSYHGDVNTERANLPPLPMIMQDGEVEFEVESIISHQRQRGKSQYLLKWLGWPLSDLTWEGEKQSTHCDSALKYFHEEAGRRSSIKGELCEGYGGLVPRRYCKETLFRVQGLLESRRLNY